MEWLEIAKNLQTGHKTRIDCECGDGKTLIVNHNIKGYSCHCFRCDTNDFAGKGKQTLAELAHIRELNEQAETIDLPLTLPEDFTTDIPLEGRLWLYSGGIHEQVWSHYGLGYSKSLHRVILPVYDSRRNLVWYQCRALSKGQKPKYIQPSKERAAVMFWGSRRDETRVIVVEDILSAIRVGKHCSAVSLLGTKITSAQAVALSKFSRVTSWLDNDKAGKDGAYKIRKTLSLLTEVDNIQSEVDPKKLSDKEIKVLLCN